MKPFKNTSLLLLSFLVLGLTYFASCDRDDKDDDPAPPSAQFGDAIIDLSDGWNFDKAHSSVLWECPYVGTGGLLTGRFNSFGVVDFHFVENDPSQITFTGWVKLNTVNTGEPGRDNGCLLKTYGVDSASMPDSIAHHAFLILKKAAYSNVSKTYDLTCDLRFHGETSEVKAKMEFTGITKFEAGEVSAKAQDVGGLTITFPMNAKTKHGIVSSSIPDVVDVQVNSTFKKTYD
jgi:polyisoprenoid-binding protein YceI